MKNEDLFLATTLAVAACFATFFAIRADAIPTQGGLYSDSFTVTCGTSATLIQSPKNQQAYQCTIPADGVEVFVGDSATSTAEGTPYAAGEVFGGPFVQEYCLVATGSQVVRCRAQVFSP